MFVEDALTVERFDAHSGEPFVIDFDVSEFLNYKAACVSRREEKVVPVVAPDRRNERPIRDKPKLP